jgi:hypothetical protein
LDVAINFSQKLADSMLQNDNRFGFGRQALATIVLSLSLGDEVDARKRLGAFNG